jgi:multidrug transporter EmrE-like cation transporter
LFATNVIFYYLALRTIPLSFAYPVMVTGSFLLLGFASTFFFREQVNMMQLLGYALVILGITLVSAFS